MFPDSHWLERKLPDIGLWIIVAGLVLLVIGMIGEALYYVSAYGPEQINKSPSRLWQAIWASVRGLANPLIYNGVVLYLFGRFVGAWMVSIVGFEHSETSSLRLKGPDDKYTVWIGRKYESLLEAEAAADALRRRMGREGSPS